MRRDLVRTGLADERAWTERIAGVDIDADLVLLGIALDAEHVAVIRLHSYLYSFLIDNLPGLPPLVQVLALRSRDVVFGHAPVFEVKPFSCNFL